MRVVDIKPGTKFAYGEGSKAVCEPLGVYDEDEDVVMVYGHYTFPDGSRATDCLPFHVDDRVDTYLTS